ncbi:hypothetical protein GGQ84_002657 [Desulfitispora alkaliphila]|uniref:DUF4446 family protein n=1 Tax=Desulfitispora alkaliphila TaxID=622674 RepID=UPI003D192BE1
MNYEQLMNNLAMYSEQILLGTVILLAICLLVFISFNIKLARLVKQYKTMMQGMDGSNLEEIMLKNREMLVDTSEQFENMKKQIDQILHKLEFSIQNVAVVRFNAFSDMGSDLSYAIAVLDQKGNGFVLSSLAGRQETRTYCKPIKNCQSQYQLTVEEEQAIERAMGNDK